MKGRTREDLRGTLRLAALLVLAGLYGTMLFVAFVLVRREVWEAYDQSGLRELPILSAALLGLAKAVRVAWWAFGAAFGAAGLFIWRGRLDRILIPGILISAVLAIALFPLTIAAVQLPLSKLQRHPR